MSLEAITSLITRRIGLDPASVGVETIARVIRRRMADCGASDADAYLRELKDSEEEWQRLIDEVVVPETWFFRDWEPFVFLQRYVTSEWLLGHWNETLRILSVPCAAGEEPYSIAMTLMDAGMGKERFKVDAVDISHGALARSRRAEYGSNSFRGGNLAFRDRYFEHRGGLHRLNAEVKETVHLLQGNILDDGFLMGGAPYDVIFCRNLLIYLTPAARERAIDVLDRLLKKEGLLFAGHAETTHVIGPRFVRVDHPRSFAYRKSGGEEAPREAAGRPATERKLATDRSAGRASFSPSWKPLTEVALPESKSPDVDVPPTPPATDPSGGKESLLERATRLADEGRLEEAVALCERIISEHGASAGCYHLLGLIHHASRNEGRAEESFNKALYLDPEYYEALVHLMLILEHRGDTRQAAALRRRAERLQALTDRETR